jgi:predicted HTH transcriptional regulator
MVPTTVELTDQDILVRLAAFEDSFVERKTTNDIGDCLKTVVAFANTAPVGYPAILFVGIRKPLAVGWVAGI